MSCNKTFCVKPFIQYASFNNNEFRLCCTAQNPSRKVKTKDISIEEIFNSDYLKEVRRKIIDGEKIRDCIDCYELEERGVTSDRIIANNSLERNKPELFEDLKNGKRELSAPLFLDLRVGNECNLKCLSCNPGCSDKIFDDFVEMNTLSENFNLYIPPQKNLPAGFTLEQLESILPNINKLKLLGGEPLISKRALSLIKYCKEQGYSKNIALHFNTNLTVFNSNFIEIFSSFDRVSMTFSIDAYGELNDYLRYPSKWDRIINNFKKYISAKRELNNLEFQIAPVIQLSNITSLHKLLNFFITDLKLHENEIDLAPIILMAPDYLSPAIAPDFIKEKAIESFMIEYNKYDYDVQKNYENFKNDLISIKKSKEDKRLLRKYIEITESFDLIRNNSIANVFPEYNELKQSLG